MSAQPPDDESPKSARVAAALALTDGRATRCRLSAAMRAQSDRVERAHRAGVFAAVDFRAIVDYDARNDLYDASLYLGIDAHDPDDFTMRRDTWVVYGPIEVCPRCGTALQGRDLVAVLAIGTGA